MHEEPLAEAFRSLGHEVIEFKWHTYFGIGKISLLKRVQRRICAGPLVDRINHDLINLANTCKADMVFIYRGDVVYPGTLETIKASNKTAILVGYNNDDPFSMAYPQWLWRHFRNALPYFDLTLAYRKHNIHEFEAAGARHVMLLRSWFVPSRNFPLVPDTDTTDTADVDVVFVGHYEQDERTEYLEEIVKQGIGLKLYGPGYDWDPVLVNNPYLKDQLPVRLAWGEDYNKALNRARIALCFFSKLNKDTYTRRCFEIPASGTLMLSQYSPDMAELFRPDKEAVYFGSKEEMIEKIRWLLTDEESRRRIARAGHTRVLSEGHDVLSRANQIIEWTQELYPETGNRHATLNN